MCSLTVTSLARLQRARRERGLDGRVRTAAITYDPVYDRRPGSPPTGTTAVSASPTTTGSCAPRAGSTSSPGYFELGVNFGPALVNRHRIELFVLDARGRVAATFARLRWDVAEVLDRAARLV